MWFFPFILVFAMDWGEDKIKETAAISSLLAQWQIGPLSNRDLIYQAKDGYWNCSTGYKSGQRIALYLRQGRHHSVVAGRGGTRPLKSLSCLPLLMDVAYLTSPWPGAAGQGPSLWLTCITIGLHVFSTFTLKPWVILLFFLILTCCCYLFFTFLFLYYCWLEFFYPSNLDTMSLSPSPSLLCTQFLFFFTVLLSLLSHCQHSFSVANQCKLRKTIMKDKTNGCCVLSCASLVLYIVLLDMIDGSLSSGNTSLLPDCTQAAIHNG